jgi:HlyD family secretion protein
MPISRKRKFIIIGVAVVVLALVVIVSVFASRKEEQEVTTVRVTRRPELKQIVTASGEVRPIQYINLTSEVQGRIEEIYVKPGDRVTRGQPVVRVDPTQLQASQEAQFAAAQAALNNVQNARTQVASAENNVAQQQQALNSAEAQLAAARQQVVAAQTSVDRARVDLNTAQRELKRTTELVEANVASRSDYDTARDRLDQAQVALRTAQAQLQQQEIAVKEAQARVAQQQVALADAKTGVNRARASVAAAEAQANQQQALLRGQSSQREKATTRSPLTGVVVDVPARVGTFAVAGLSTTALMTIADMSTVNVEVNVDETEIAKVEIGQPVKIKVDALSDQEIEGTVTQKNPLAQTKSGTGSGLTNTVNVQEAKEFKVVIEMKNLNDEVHDKLRPGMTATASITTAVRKDVLAVPLQAVVPKPTPTPSAASTANSNSASPTPTPVEKQNDEKGVFVFDNGKAKFYEVTTGINGESDIEITSGLNPGVEVITGPSRVLQKLKNGDAVKRQTRKTESNANAK